MKFLQHFLQNGKVKQGIEASLRAFMAFTFASHGMKALFIEEAWIVMFTTVGISANAATILMPLIGVIDLLVALALLLRPWNFLLLWAAFWPSVPAFASYVTGNSDIAHEVMHAVLPIVACILIYVLREGVSKRIRYLAISFLVLGVISMMYGGKNSTAMILIKNTVIHSHDNAVCHHNNPKNIVEGQHTSDHGHSTDNKHDH